MDLFFIVGGMILGTVVATLVATVVPGLNEGLRILLYLLGAMSGGAAGFALVWLEKRDDRRLIERNKILAQPTTYRPPQIVGKPCCTCQETIIFIVDADLCEMCRRIFCKRCEPNVPCSQCRAGIAIAKVVPDQPRS